ncbi:hypothetical protein SCLCIDRAFT_294478 [Scleroderma citrinum Foug A]|uniref:Uncharacterized protein n=1 Tax=Scleroderma citrinum Foug A TaxID=1036808 RepID=A0A0C3E1Q6_9AGAM|nr:hypothetical protein SCLCIDRAFT_294478 [Scleroderma citrinum Foug A]
MYLVSSRLRTPSGPHLRLVAQVPPWVVSERPAAFPSHTFRSFCSSRILPFDLSVPSILAIALQTFPRFCLFSRHIDSLIPCHVFTSSCALLTYGGSGDYLP